MDQADRLLRRRVLGQISGTCVGAVDGSLPMTLRQKRSMDESVEMEARRAGEGINPMFGEWRQQFALEPLSYSNPGAARLALRQAIRDQLRNKFVFVGKVRLTITLYLDEQKLLETPAYGDLDNYAKQRLDSLKGNGGLFIDDCQVQRLDISWIDMPYSPRFEIEITSSLDDLLPERLELYEMPDGLYYPISSRVWTKNGLVAIDRSAILALCNALALMTKAKKTIRHQLRQECMPQFRSFQYGKYVSLVFMGFHRSRVVDSGYPLHGKQSW